MRQVTRPGIVFAVSRLARYLTNPGPLHQAAADRMLLYLKRYRNLGLQLGGGDEYVGILQRLTKLTVC